MIARIVSTVPIILICAGLRPLPCVGDDWIVRLDLGGHELEGKPLFWDKQRFVLLTRDGRLWDLDIQRAQGAQRIARPFEGLTIPEMRAALIREFGPYFDVASTGHYLVVHPAGQGDQWPGRFEQLYREMIPYFAKRGISMHEPVFPLVAIVFPTQHHFLEYAQQAGMPLSAAILGLYEPMSNRIMLYDVTAGGQVDNDWRVNAETIVHEAAHQTAFNCGIHSRYNMPPRWICEGLGTLFEARGVYDSGHYPDQTDRLNHQQLEIYRKYFAQGLPKGSVSALVANDKFFSAYPGAAYALSWGLTFMIAETQPHLLSEYLQLTAHKRPFRQVEPAERLGDFQRVFGTDLYLFESHLHRYLGELSAGM